MQKISLFDFARISRRETTNKCNPAVGDLVRIDCVTDPRKSVIGIVTVLNDTNMCIIVDNKFEWWSRYTDCTILSNN